MLNFESDVGMCAHTFHGYTRTKKVFTSLCGGATYLQAVDARGYYEWPNDTIYAGKSSVAGMGLFSKVDIDAGQVVLRVLLPDED